MTSIIKNYLYNLSYQIFAIILPIITIPYVSRTLGAEGIGIYSYTTSIVQYFIIIGSLGVNNYGQKIIAKNRMDKEQLNKKFTEIFLLKLICLIIILIIYLLFVVSIKTFRVFYFLQTINILNAIVDVTWLYYGVENFKSTVIRNFFIKIISFFLIICFVKSSKDLELYFIIMLGSYFLGNISLWYGIKKYFVWKIISLKKIFSHFRPAVIMLIPQIATTLYSYIDKTMIGLFYDKSMVGYYDQAYNIILISITLLTTLGGVMMSRVSYLDEIGDNSSIKRLINSSFIFTLLISIPLCLGIIAISDSFVPIFFGAGFEPVSNLLKCLSLLIVLVSFNSVVGTQYLIPTNRQKIYNVIIVFSVCVNVLLNLILIPKYNIYGAAIASVVSESLITLIEFFLLKKDLKYSNLKKYFFTIVMCAIIMYIIIRTLNSYLDNSIYSLIIRITVAIIAYFILIFNNRNMRKFIENLKYLE